MTTYILGIITGASVLFATGCLLLAVDLKKKLAAKDVPVSALNQAIQQNRSGIARTIRQCWYDSRGISQIH